MGSLAYARWVSVFLALSIAIATIAAPLRASAQVAGSVSASAAATESQPAAPPPEKPSALDHWWFGGYYRYNWVPAYITSAFFSRAPGISNNGFGFVATYRTLGGLNVEFGFGHMPYRFHGPFLARDSEVTDTELIRSDIDLWHITSSLLWDIEFHPVIALEIGFGIDFGLLTGHLTRNEAYYDSATKQFKDCTGPLDPSLVGPVDSKGNPGAPYCNVPENGSYDPTKTPPYTSDAADAKGEQYHLRDNHVPPVMLFPMVPRLALRIQPIKYVAIKAEFAFGVVQMFVGASLHVNFGFAKASPEAAPPPPKPAEPEPVVVHLGRVLGSVIDDDTKAPVTGAIVQRTVGGAVATLTTDASGRFVVDRLDPGLAHFDVQHPDYQPAVCEAQIPANGGDVPLMCHVHQITPTGAISGQVQGEKGVPIETEGIELAGPHPQKLKSDSHGLFAAVDLPVGAYRLNVDADGYLAQSVEVAVQAHQTAMPQVTLVKKPKKVLVELRKEEIVITQQIQFKLGSAEILGESSNVLRQVADVLLRNPQINQLEIQGHTDNKGGHDMNMQLSQARADSVRNWLVQAGVPADHLQAAGYGPDNPIRPNNTAANRALNRRVQFIIHAQGGQP